MNRLGFEITADNAASYIAAIDIARIRACERSAEMMRQLGDPGGEAFFKRLAYLPAGIIPPKDDRDDGGNLPIKPAPSGTPGAVK